MNPNDYEGTSAIYKFIDLSLLNDEVSLNFPENEYLINTKSHTVYNFTGVKLDGKWYNALPLDYKYTEYNELHPVANITLKNIPGIAEVVGGNKIIYYATDLTELNLKDLLSFNQTGTDGLAEPKSVTFSCADTAGFNLGSESGILKKPASVDMNKDLQITATATNYKNASTPSITFKVQVSSLNIKKGTSSVTYPTSLNLLTKQTQSTYVYQKSSTPTSGENAYGIVTGGVLTSSTNVVPTSGSPEIATATYNSSGQVVVFNGGTKAGKTTIDCVASGYGLAKDTMEVNVFDYKIYSGSAGSNTNIDKLEFTGLGDDAKINVKFNLEAPEGFDINATGNAIEWSLVTKSGDSYVADSTGIVTITGSDKTTKTITPQKVGKTMLKCDFKVAGELLGTSVIPITVSGIESNGTAIAADNSISINKSTIKNTGVKIKYTFGDSSITASNYEVLVSPSAGFTVPAAGTSNTFVIKYTGTSDVTATVTIRATVGDKIYEDKIQVKVAN